MRAARKRWTDSDDAILVKTMLNAKNNAEGYTEAMKLLGRSRAGVVARYAQGRYKQPDQLLNIDNDNIEEVEVPIIKVKSLNTKLKEKLVDRSNQLNYLLIERTQDESTNFANDHAFILYSTMMNDIVTLINKIK